MARATGRSSGRGRAAQSSGRPHEPSGNRRPEMDDRRRGFGRGTELGLQAGSPPLLPPKHASLCPPPENLPKADCPPLENLPQADSPKLNSAETEFSPRLA
jgi:hypothetical protein